VYVLEQGFIPAPASQLDWLPVMQFASLTKSIAVPHQIHTYNELRQQIHNDLRMQHPEWVQPNGESPMCDSYDARLMEQLDTLTRRGSNESIAAPHHGEPSSGLKHRLHARKGDFPSQ
jgi:hypothetical protein